MQWENLFDSNPLFLWYFQGARLSFVSDSIAAVTEAQGTISKAIAI
jgi:hypothetical protein